MYCTLYPYFASQKKNPLTIANLFIMLGWSFHYRYSKSLSLNKLYTTVNVTLIIMTYFIDP